MHSILQINCYLCNTNNETHIKLKYYLICTTNMFSTNLFILRDVLSELKFYIIEFHKMLPIYHLMYNQHKIKNKIIGYHVNLFYVSISKF